MKLNYSRLALNDLEEIAVYIAQDNPQRAHSFVDELEEKCRILSENPKLYRPRDEIAANLRMATHGDYLIFYRETDQGVRIERILHGARNIETVFS